VTRDHKATDPEEVARIVASGGFVQAGRLCGDLDVVRALGDYEYKQPPVGGACGGFGGVEEEAEEAEDAEEAEEEQQEEGGGGSSGTTMAREQCAATHGTCRRA